jgi:hypothetical protein
MVTQSMVHWTCVAVAMIIMIGSGPALEASADPESDTDYLTCVSDLGRLNHYYHFMLNCLIPSVLHVHSQPTHKFVLCNDDLSHKDLDMLSHYKTVLPGVNTSSDCGDIDSAKILTLPTYDDRRGSQVMRLDKDSWSTFQNHFKEMSPHNYSHDVISGKQDIILIKRLNSTASSLPTYIYIFFYIYSITKNNLTKVKCLKYLRQQQQLMNSIHNAQRFQYINARIGTCYSQTHSNNFDAKTTQKPGIIFPSQITI